jgi:hypothetical protein
MSGRRKQAGLLNLGDGQSRLISTASPQANRITGGLSTLDNQPCDLFSTFHGALAYFALFPGS